jgi:hypothetical protein
MLFANECEYPTPMGPNRRAQERERAAARATAEAKRAEVERSLADAQKIVAIWNARQAGRPGVVVYPTIAVACNPIDLASLLSIISR